MTVHIDEVSTVIEPTAGSQGRSEAGAPAQPAPEVRLEDLRALVRALVAEEIERWLRLRGDAP